MLEQQLIQQTQKRLQWQTKIKSTTYSHLVWCSAVDISDEQERFITKVYVYSLAVYSTSWTYHSYRGTGTSVNAAREENFRHSQKLPEISFGLVYVNFLFELNIKTTVIKVQVKVEKIVEEVEVPLKEKEFIYIQILTDD